MTKALRMITSIVWIVLCIFTSIDTRLFVYTSLSQALLTGLCILLLASLALVHFACGIRNTYKPQPLNLNAVNLTVVIWGAYLLFHSEFVTHAQEYRLIYLEESFLLILTLPYHLRSHLLEFRQLKHGVILMSILQLSYLILQLVGIMKPVCSSYSLTGCNENPNSTAMLLAMSVPFLIERIRNKEKSTIYFIILSLSLIFLLIIKCRTAFVGLIVYAISRWILLKKNSEELREVKKKTRRYLLGCTILFVAVFLLSNMKKESSQGRLFIWKLSAVMMAEHPEGCGIGKFEHDYNLRQGEYFLSEGGTETERRIASNVYMAYNDFLEHGVEAGVAGLAVMIVFYFVVLRNAYRQKDAGMLSLISAFLAMSLVNYGFVSMQTWLIMLCCCGKVSAGCKEMNVACMLKNDKVLKAANVTFSLSVMICLYVFARKHYDLASSQLQLASMKCSFENGKDIDMEKACHLQDAIGTSEAYWSFLSSVYYKQEDYAKSLYCTEKAMEYTSSIANYYQAFFCLDRMNDTQSGTRYLKTISDMIPQNLTSRMILMKCHDRFGQKDSALHVAEEIANMNVKVRNLESDDIQKQARMYVDYYLKNQTNNIYNYEHKDQN